MFGNKLIIFFSIGVSLIKLKSLAKPFVTGTKRAKPMPSKEAARKDKITGIIICLGLAPIILKKNFSTASFAYKGVFFIFVFFTVFNIKLLPAAEELFQLHRSLYNRHLK